MSKQQQENAENKAKENILEKGKKLATEHPKATLATTAVVGVGVGFGVGYLVGKKSAKKAENQQQESETK